MSSSSAAASTTTTSTITINHDDKIKRIKLHPLAISSICDHYTRVILGGSKLSSKLPIMGLLFGTLNGLDISIVDTSDSLYEIDKDNNLIFLNDELLKKIELWVAVFPSHELLGWYTFGTDVTSSIMDIHKVVTIFHKTNFTESSEKKTLCSESPLLLLMNSSPDPQSKQLPLQIFETEMHTTSNENQEITTPVFIDLTFELETNQAERIAIDQVTKLSGTESVSTLEVQNQTSSTSLRKLDEKIKILLSALEAMKQNKIPIDHHILRMAAKLNDFFSTASPQTFDDDFVDNMIVSYLGAATKTTAELATLTDLYQTSFADNRHYM